MADNNDIIKRMYVQKRKQDALNVNIKLPEQFGRNYLISNAPTDLQNLMQDFGKDSKFKNVKGMMSDPTKTFNHAQDNAMNAFANLAKLCFHKADKSNVMPTASNGLNDNLLMFGDTEINLNEGIASTIALAMMKGSAIATANAIPGGAVLGATSGILFTGAGASVLAGGVSFFATAMPIIATLYGSGYAIGRILKNGGISGGGAEDDSALLGSNIDTKDLSSLDTDKAWHGEDAITAIDEYLNQLTASLRSVLSDIAGKTDGFSTLVDKINDYVATDAQALKDFMAKNNERLKEIEERKREKELQNASKEGAENITNKLNNFGNKLKDLFIGKNSNDDTIAQLNILRKYNDVLTSTRSTDKELKNQLEDIVNGEGGYKELMDLYKSKISKTKSTGILDDSVQYDGKNMLTEDADGDENDTLSIDTTEQYKMIRNEIKKIIDGMFPLRGGDNLPGIAEAKASMEALKKSANEEITTKIDQICRISNSGENSGLSDKIKGFLSKHPMDAKNLQSIWGRHVEDLNARMTQRLNDMKDYGNANRIIGWTAKFCQEVVPDVIARMLCVRYVLSILQSEGVYTYTTESEKLTDKLFEQEGEALKYLILNNILLCLAQYGNQYTDNEQPIVENNENGYQLTENPRTYIIFLIMNLIKNMTQEKLQILAEINNFQGSAEDFAMLILTIISGEGNDALIMSSDVQPLLEKFMINPQYNNNKELIKNTYNRLVELGKSMSEKSSGVDMVSSLNVILSNPKVLDIYMSKRDTIDKLADEYNSDDTTKERKSAIVKELKGSSYFNVDFSKYKVSDVPSADIKSMLSNTDNKVYDYYTFILSLYFGFKLDKVFEYSIAENIKEICETTYNAFALITKGVLVLGSETSPYTSSVIDLISMTNNFIQSPKDNYDTFISNLGDNDVKGKADEIVSDRMDDGEFWNDLSVYFNDAVEKYDSIEINGVDKPKIDFDKISENGIKNVKSLMENSELVSIANDPTSLTYVNQVRNAIMYMFIDALGKSTDNIYTETNKETFNEMGNLFADIKSVMEYIKDAEDIDEEDKKYFNEKCLEIVNDPNIGIPQDKRNTFIASLANAEEPKEFWESIFDKDDENFADNIQNIYASFENMDEDWVSLSIVSEIIEELIKDAE